MPAPGTIVVHVRAPSVAEACRALAERYDRDLAAFVAKQDEGELPLWMRPSDAVAARALLQAKRDVVRDLAAMLELGGG